MEFVVDIVNSNFILTKAKSSFEMYFNIYWPHQSKTILYVFKIEVGRMCSRFRWLRRGWKCTNKWGELAETKEGAATGTDEGERRVDEVEDVDGDGGTDQKSGGSAEDGCKI